MNRVEYKPREYAGVAQAHMLSQPRCGAWFGMGMGKTSMSLFALDTYRLGYGSAPRTLVLGPKRVAKNVWPAEVAKWKGLEWMRVSPIMGDQHERKAALMRDADLYTINYENIQWLIKELDGSWPFDMVIADESTKLKSFRGGWRTNKTSGKTHYARGGGARAAELGSIAHRTKYWMNLTGTPAPNGLEDLWGQTWFLDFGKRLGNSYTAFTNRWFRMKPGSAREQAIFEPLPNAHDEIMGAIKDLHLTLDPYDYFDVERPRFVPVKCELTAAQTKQYKELHRESVLPLLSGQDIFAPNAGAKINKCLQYASGCVLDEDGTVHHIHDHKLEALDSVLEELNGAPVIVTYWYKHDLVRLKARYPKGRVLDDKKSTEDAWNSGTIPILFVHPASASHGLSLQYGGHNMVMFTPTFDLELFDQVIERIGPVRQAQAGFKRLTNVYLLVTEGTWDQPVFNRLSLKTTVQESIKEAMKL